MSSSTFTTARKIWTKLANKEYRDSFVASNIANTVSSQIFTLRDQRGWTQKELAQRAGMGQSRIPALEDPNLENFEIGTLKRIASAFDVAVIVRFVPFSELVTWTAELSEEKLQVADFANDSPSSVPTNSPLQVFYTDPLSYGFVAGPTGNTFGHVLPTGATGASNSTTIQVDVTRSQMTSQNSNFSTTMIPAQIARHG